MISKTALKILHKMAQKIESLEKQVNKSDETENNSMKAIIELLIEEQTTKGRHLPGHTYFPGKSEKERKELRDFIKKRSGKECIEILETNPILELNHALL